MPQLDSLTYFSQYVYLCFSFVAVYVFALNVIIPKVVSTQKMREKLTCAALVRKLENTPLNQYQLKYQLDDVESLQSYEYQGSAKLKKAWSSSARTYQKVQLLYLKKLLFGLDLVPYKNEVQ